MLVDFQANVKKRDRILIRQGREQGIEQGREQGIEQGIEQGKEQGILQGIKETEAKALAEKIEIAKKLSKKGLTIEDISESTGLDITVIQNAVEAI
jgi:predicted transposase YdaD